MPVGGDQKVPQLLLLVKLALVEFGQPSSIGQVAQPRLQVGEFHHLVGGEGLEELFGDEEVEVAELAGLEVAVLGELFPFEDGVPHFVVDPQGFLLLLLCEFFVLDVDDLAVPFGDFLDDFEEHHHVEFDFHLGGVGVVQELPVLVALQVVEVGFLEQGPLHAELPQEEVVLVDALVVDLDVLVDLQGVLRVLDRLVVASQFPLAH